MRDEYQPTAKEISGRIGRALEHAEEALRQCIPWDVASEVVRAIHEAALQSILHREAFLRERSEEGGDE